MIEVFRADSEVIDRLNRTVRALIRAEDAAHWKEILLDGVGAYCERCLLARPTNAPAIAQALDSRETVVAANVPTELSESISRHFDGAARVLIVPICDSTRAYSALVADGVRSTSAIELLAAAASLALPREPFPADLVSIPLPSRDSHQFPSRNQPFTEPRPSGSGLLPTSDTRPDHLRAQHFARIRVAEMQLHHAPAVQAGRRSANLFQTLQPYIESAREEFRRRYLEKTGSMADYLHIELVRTLANNDEAMLGAEYPGPLV